ncbi:hypothetical protein CJ030_MR0G028241 [Morella rubra]|uniref:Uncharacterized protein n=1 Tax=Morella rubra TaxID=262757 RepID=A0A6A1UFH3_9ROSI|nr:hypothetical protein CJ030_MR0G028241 [Morella rubra]
MNLGRPSEDMPFSMTNLCESVPLQECDPTLNHTGADALVQDALEQCVAHLSQDPLVNIEAPPINTQRLEMAKQSLSNITKDPKPTRRYKGKFKAVSLQSAITMRALTMAHKASSPKSHSKRKSTLDPTPSLSSPPKKLKAVEVFSYEGQELSLAALMGSRNRRGKRRTGNTSSFPLREEPSSVLPDSGEAPDQIVGTQTAGVEGHNLPPPEP